MGAPTSEDAVPSCDGELEAGGGVGRGREEEGGRWEGPASFCVDGGLESTPGGSDDGGLEPSFVCLSSSLCVHVVRV